jgi:alpha-ketoglutarate-dependent taurine dioxygenase
MSSFKSPPNSAPLIQPLPVGRAIILPDTASLEMLYAHTVLIIPSLWDYCEKDERTLYRFHRRFGVPWDRDTYALSGERGGLLPDVNLTLYTDSSYARLAGASELPWHSDVPIYGEKKVQWPIRSLTAAVLPPNPVSTSFVSMFELYDLLSQDEKEFASQVTLTYQSWYVPGSHFVQMPLVQSHPVTGRKFLAMNSFNPGKMSELITKHWIQRATIAGDTVERSGAEILGRYSERIEALAYRHEWVEGDMVVFDNTGLMHRRDGAADLNNPRRFYRANIHHAHQAG